jgi:predicted ATPase
LPVALTGLIGREQVVDAVSALLVDPEVRLVTLSGPAGVGKTRLALAVAAGVQPRFADGSLFVPLETIADPDLVLPAVARAAAVTAAPGEALDAVLFEAIQARHLLLVLDNFEQIVDAAPQVAVLLTACPTLTALVTSRAALRVRGERLVPVPPLAEPDAVRLFLERARAMAPEAAPDETATIADICRRLDGLPLAIELAAARTRLLPPHEVLDRLTQPLTLLTGGPRDLPERHQALREAIAWSYDLLTPDEQAVFRRLAVFAGGCTLEAAATVCAAPGSLEIDPLDGLEVLVDHSLVRRERDGGDAGTRLRLLETLREFAWDRLAAAGEQAVTERAHARMYLELAERAVGELIGPTLGLWLDRLEREHDNLRRALRWAVEGCEVAIALRLGAALSRFWSLRGHYREGWRWLEESLALPGVATVSPAVRSRALNAAGILALTCNEYGRAEVLFEEGLVAARASGDALLVAEALNSVGGAARARGDTDRAVSLFEEALSLPGVSGYPRAVARSLFNLAMVARHQEDFDRADALLRQCRDLQGLLGDRQAVAVTLNVLGSVAFARGERARAAALHREGLALQEAIGHKRGLAVSYTFMCAESAAAGDALEASDVCRRALLACREIGERWNTAECLASLARVTALRGRPDGAARLLGAAARQRTGSLNPQEQRSAEAQLMAEVRAHLGATAFDARWAEGQALSFDGAVALGLAAAAAARRPERARPRPRTVREG